MGGQKQQEIFSHCVLHAKCVVSCTGMNGRAVGEHPPVDDLDEKHNSEMLFITLLRPYLFPLVIEGV